MKWEQCCLLPGCVSFVWTLYVFSLCIPLLQFRGRWTVTYGLFINTIFWEAATPARFCIVFGCPVLREQQ